VPKPKPGLPTVEDAQRAVATIKVKFPVARFTFEDAEEYEAGTEMLREVKAQQKDLEEKRKAITKPMDEAKKNILALFKPPEDRLKTAENVLRAAVLDWQRQQEAERRAIEAELREKQRLLQAAAEEEAEKLREEGHDLQAAATLALVPPVPTVFMDAPKADGIGNRSTWKAEVVDFEMLVKAVAAGLVPESYLQVNQTALNAAARSLKTAAKIPGVKVYEEAGLVVRA
jgi:hypothetical protein